MGCSIVLITIHHTSTNNHDCILHMRSRVYSGTDCARDFDRLCVCCIKVAAYNLDLILDKRMVVIVVGCRLVSFSCILVRPTPKARLGPTGPAPHPRTAKL